MTSAPGAPQTCPMAPSAVAGRYETLRMAGLGEALPPQARDGLMLFLGRGMWGWARTLAVQAGREEPVPQPLASPVSSCEREAIVDVLAALAIATSDRRAS